MSSVSYTNRAYEHEPTINRTYDCEPNMTETIDIGDSVAETTTPRESTSVSILTVVSLFAERTSINGLLMIKTSTSFGAKILWCFLFIAAVGALVFHSY
ncbi:degenerin protein asic-2, partial [Biomphalaria glabrata]